MTIKVKHLIIILASIFVMICIVTVNKIVDTCKINDTQDINIDTSNIRLVATTNEINVDKEIKKEQKVSSTDYYNNIEDIPIPLDTISLYKLPNYQFVIKGIDRCTGIQFIDNTNEKHSRITIYEHHSPVYPIKDGKSAKAIAVEMTQSLAGVSHNDVEITEINGEYIGYSKATISTNVIAIISNKNSYLDNSCDYGILYDNWSNTNDILKEVEYINNQLELTDDTIEYIKEILNIQYDYDEPTPRVEEKADEEKIVANILKPVDAEKTENIEEQPKVEIKITSQKKEDSKVENKNKQSKKSNSALTKKKINNTNTISKTKKSEEYILTELNISQDSGYKYTGTEPATVIFVPDGTAIDDIHAITILHWNNETKVESSVLGGEKYQNIQATIVQNGDDIYQAGCKGLKAFIITQKH